MKGRILWVLHAHLPYVRHPEHPRFFEEDWLFEAIETCYLPLQAVFRSWVRDGLPARVVFSVSPPLLAMWQDRLLQDRFRAYLDRRSALFAEEQRRLRSHPELGALARSEAARVAEARRQYEQLEGDLARGFAELAASGVVELITCSATHALLPSFSRFPGFVRAQIRAGLESHARAFGQRPLGIWLPECGWFEGIDAELLEAGVRYTFVEGTGLYFAKPTPAFGFYRSVLTDRGLMVMARDPVVARAVWSRDVGYPGDGRYLDFYKDSTADRTHSEVLPHLLPTGARVPLGLRYHRVTDRNSDANKMLYDPEAAVAAAWDHAEDFVSNRIRTLEECGEKMGLRGCSVAPFDAELFGHWWREGPFFLDCAARVSRDRLDWVTGKDLLESGEPWEIANPAPSTWGEAGDLSVWISPETAAMWPPILDAVSSLEHFAERFRSWGAKPGEKRAYAQWAREVFLAAASDWPFLVRMGTAGDYAKTRLAMHIERAGALEAMLRGGEVDVERVAQFEESDDIFPFMNYETLRR